MTEEKISLYKKDERSDKEYHVQLVQEADLWSVKYQNGKRGGTLASGLKTPQPVAYAVAKKKYGAVVKEKLGDGYTPGKAGTAFVGGDLEKRFTGIVPHLLNPINESEVEQYLLDPNWVMQEKKDGHRRLAKKDAQEVVGINRKGLVTGLPETVLDALKLLAERHSCFKSIILDGELMGDEFAIFDVLEVDGANLRDNSLESRLQLLDSIGETLADAKVPKVYVVPTARTEAQKRALHAKLKAAKAEGAVYKEAHAPYVAGRPSSGGTQVKEVWRKNATCIVEKLHATKRSVHVALLDAKGDMVSVGKCTIPANQAIPAVGVLVEINYLYAFPGGSLFQPLYKGLRDDIERDACTLTQLHYKAGTAEDNEEEVVAA